MYTNLHVTIDAYDFFNNAVVYEIISSAYFLYSENFVGHE